MNQGTRGRLIKGAAWLGGARVIVNLLSLASTIILARLLTPEDFGLVALVTAISAVVAGVTELSLAQSLIKLDDPTEEDFRTAWSLNLLRACLLALVLVALAVPVARAYGEPRLVPMFLVIAAGSAVFALENPKLVVFQRNLVFSRDFLVSSIDKIVAFVVAVAIAYFYRTYWALVLGTVAAYAARVALSYILIPFRPSFTLASSRSLLSFSIWISFANLVKMVNLKSIPLVIGATLPTASVGVFSLGERVSAIPLRESIGALQNVLYPAYVRIAEDRRRLTDAYMRAQSITCLIAFALGFGMAAIAHPIVLVLLGEKWLPAVPIIQIIAAAGAIVTIQNVMPLAMAVGRPEQLLYRNLRSFALQMPLMAAGYWIGIGTAIGPLIGIVGGFGCAMIVNTFLNLCLIKRLVGLGLRRQMAAGLRPLLAALAMVAAIQIGAPLLAGAGLLPLFQLILQIAIGGAVFLASLALLVSLSGRGPSAEKEAMDILKSYLGRAVSRGRAD